MRLQSNAYDSLIGFLLKVLRFLGIFKALPEPYYPEPAETLAMDFLVTIGHLGKDTGAVSPYDASDEDGIAIQQEERWVNTQQAIGMMIAYHADTGPKPDIKFAAPKGQFENLCMGYDLLSIDDPYFSLTDRTKLANTLGRWLIEFHNNSAPFNAKGAEIICYSHKSSGYQLGKTILTRLEGAGIRNRGVKTLAELGRDLTLIQKTAKVAIILEGGFLSNKAEMEKLDVDLDSYNEQYGALIYMGVRDYWLAHK